MDEAKKELNTPPESIPAEPQLVELDEDQLDQIADRLSGNITAEVTKAVKEKMELAAQAPAPQPEPETEPEKKRGFPFIIVGIFSLVGIAAFIAVKAKKPEGTAQGAENAG
ncbi:hypothetical protein WCX49_06655 [Sulfurimonas sp. HSL-1656]|uniref:hypothetical protein n=1 Tax=Thiomicrolovo subterrani TaxID=3131934 RepID=UPI0031F938C2